MSQDVPVGAHPWVFAATQPQHDIYPILDQVFADMKYAGLDCIELMHTALLPEGAADRIARLAREHALPVIGSSYIRDMWDRSRHEEVLAEARQVVDALAAVGGRTLGVSVGFVPGYVRKTPDQLDAQADLLRELDAFCQDRGVVINLHNHTYEVQDNLHDLRGTLHRLPHLKLGPDLNWLVRAGVEPVDFIRRFRDRIVFLHLRDQGADGRWSEALGEGVMDYPAIAAALREIGFRGDCVIELAHEWPYTTTRPLRETLKISRDFVRRVFGW